ncbi:MAG: ISAs1 family transposase [Roseovarius sp.]|jgi:hypothetical protein|nr:ISAs1 family transposase [Roseovarius sp.]
MTPFSDLFHALDPVSFQPVMARPVAGFARGLDDVIAIDGKVFRQSFASSMIRKDALTMVRTFAAEARLVFGQIVVRETSNEITAMPALLDLEGRIVTADAMHTQRATAKTISLTRCTARIPRGLRRRSRHHGPCQEKRAAVETERRPPLDLVDRRPVVPVPSCANMIALIDHADHLGPENLGQKNRFSLTKRRNENALRPVAGGRKRSGQDQLRGRPCR